jgi:hypothetical protein
VIVEKRLRKMFLSPKPLKWFSFPPPFSSDFWSHQPYNGDRHPGRWLCWRTRRKKNCGEGVSEGSWESGDPWGATSLRWSMGVGLLKRQLGLRRELTAFTRKSGHPLW